MTHKLTRLLPMLLVSTLTLVACGKSDNPAAVAAASNTSPEAAVMSMVKLLKAGDFNALAHAALPPEDYAMVAREWTSKVNQADAITDEDRKQFTEQMAKLTAPDCAAQMFKEVQPALAEFDSKYKAQLPLYVGMGQTMAASAIDQSKNLDAAQKQQAKDTMAALGQWVQSTNWGDQAKAQQALGIVCDTARSLGLTTLDAARKMSFEQALGKYGQVWGGARQVFGLYGFDINGMLDSVQAKTVSNDGTHAVVATTVTLFGKPMTSNTKLVQRDGHWYNEDMLKNLEKEMTEHAAAAASAGAAESSH